MAKTIAEYKEEIKKFSEYVPSQKQIVVFGKSPSGKYKPVLVSENGKLLFEGDVDIRWEEGRFEGYAWNSVTNQYEFVAGYANNIEYQYDSLGNLISETWYLVDENGNPVATIKKTYTYDSLGNLVGESRWEKI